MKNLLLLILALQTTQAISQQELEKAVEKSVCTCISKEKDLTHEDFLNCLETSMEDHYNLIIEGLAKEKDTSENAAYRYGRKLFDKIGVSLVFSCTEYFELMQELRESSFLNLNEDSLKKEQEKLAKIDENKRDEMFYTQRGILYFQQKERGRALEDFNTVLKINPNAILPTLYKGWLLEIKEEYDESIALYNKLARLANRNEFKIFAAIAQRKKEMK